MKTLGPNASFEEQSLFAQSILGKDGLTNINPTYSGVPFNLGFIPAKIEVVFAGSPKLPLCVQDYLKRYNQKSCLVVANKNGSMQFPVGWIVTDQNLSVILNDEYTATISKDKIQVGCQTFPIDKVREIVKLHDENYK